MNFDAMECDFDPSSQVTLSRAAAAPAKKSSGGGILSGIFGLFSVGGSAKS